MSIGVLLAGAVAVSAALYSVFARFASRDVDSLFGAVVISSTALVAELALLLPRLPRTQLFTAPRGVLFALLAGLCAIGIDYLTLRAYASGLRLSVGAPIIIGGGIMLSTVAGFVLGERIDPLRAGGVCLVVSGAVLLAVSGR